MKKFILIFTFFAFMSFTTNTAVAVNASNKEFSQGFYSVTELGLLPNTSYNVQSLSLSTPVSITVFNSNQQIQQSLKLEPGSIKKTLVPLQLDYTIVIAGKGYVVFSS